MNSKLLLTGHIVLLLIGAIAIYASQPTIAIADSEDVNLDDRSITVYKSASCGCCQKWIDHAEDSGFSAKIKNTDNMSAVKARFDISPQYRSCHTSVSKNGFVFEGHVPANLIKRFLSNPPAGAIGLAAPGMPIGSPGMEVGDMVDPYDVLLLMGDGESRVFERIKG